MDFLISPHLRREKSSTFAARSAGVKQPQQVHPGSALLSRSAAVLLRLFSVSPSSCALFVVVHRKMYEESSPASSAAEALVNGGHSTHASSFGGAGGVGGGYPAIPTSAAHIAEQVESGGARVEETLMRLNCKYQTLFFCAGMAAVFAGALGAISSLLTLQLTCLVNSIFLLVFGFLMMLLDVPGAPRWAARYRAVIRKYFRFLTRLTGKALWLMFLGSMTAVTLWPSSSRRGGGGSHALLFLTICLSFYIMSVSIVGLLIAIRKSLRLEKARKAVLLSCKGAYIDVYRKYAMTDPQHGMQFEEFNRLSADVTGGRLQFDITDLGIIYNALDEHQKSAINEREFSEWMTDVLDHVQRMSDLGDKWSPENIIAAALAPEHTRLLLLTLRTDTFRRSLLSPW